ncbi:MAG: glycosyltransferase family 4 protein [Oscillochloris sp.]|nr:glycosyltransferase family 4 protein [Oscillochloris sp.]
MKIAFISLEYPPYLLGGAGVYIFQMTSKLSLMGHEVHVITPGTNTKYDYAQELGVHVHRVPVKLKQRVFSFWATLPKIFQRINKSVSGFDIIHGNGISDLTLSNTSPSQTRIVTVHHLSSSVVNVLQPSLWDRLRQPGNELGLIPLIEPIPIRRAKHIIAVSEYTKKDLITTLGLIPETISIIRHGANPNDYIFSPEEIAQVRNQLGISSERLVLSVGRLESRKGIEVLLRAFSTDILKVSAVLALVGSGSQEVYKAMASDLGIAERVRFCGHVNDVTLRKLYAACDLFVFPSLMEGLGIAALEARAAGKLVVASDVGGVPEVVPPNAGYLVPPGQVRPLAEALHDALTTLPHTLPPVSDWDTAAKSLEACYQRLAPMSAASKRF